MKVLMVGATGPNAGLVLPELLSRGVEVRALVRGEGRAREARAAGAQEAVIGDLTEPDSLRAAADGVDGVFHLNPAFAPGEGEMGVAMVRAADDAGARKFVFSSTIHSCIGGMVNHREKRPVEEALVDSDLEFTVLQPSMFMQNLARLPEQARRTGRVAFPYSPRARTCWVDYRDVAEVAALAMTGDALGYGIFELCAPGMIDCFGFARLLSEVTGQDVEAGEVPLEDAARSIPAGPFRDGLARMWAYYDENGYVGGNDLVLRTILGREPRSLRDYLAEVDASS